LFRGAPPIDFAETDLGYVGSQHRMLLKIPQGQIIVDAKRGQVFLISGTEAIDLSAFGSGMNRFFVEHLPFMIDNNFPDVKIDNHFKGLGLHGVYDAVYDRVIITKLDYAPKSNNILYDPVEQEFYINNIVNGLTIRQNVSLSDEQYFCNVSWTLSFNMNTKSWISFHSYIPNFYIAENNFFYSGQNNCCEEFDFLVGVLVPNPSTTTTTSTTRATTTTTTTTVAPLQCNITATVQQINCSLAGVGVIVSLDCTLVGPTTSTTSTSTTSTSTTSTSTTSTTSTSTTSTTTSTTSSTTTTTTTAEPTTTTTSTSSTTTTTSTTATPTTTTTTTPAPVQYTFLVYDIDVNCNTNNPQPFWSFTNYANGFYYINGNLSTLYSLQSNTHTNYTNEITQVLAGTCGTTTTTTTTTSPPTTTTTTTTESPTITTTTTSLPTTTTTTTTSTPYCYEIESIQSAPGECFDCPGNFASTTDTFITFYDGCGGTQIPAPFNINVTANYSDASTQNTFIPSGATGSILIATSDVQCAPLPSCGEVASPTFVSASVIPVTGSISECCGGPS
jgi:hypothetical protein